LVVEEFTGNLANGRRELGAVHKLGKDSLLVRILLLNIVQEAERIEERQAAAIRHYIVLVLIPNR
jgi:hypothetical protein